MVSSPSDARMKNVEKPIPLYLGEEVKGYKKIRDETNKMKKRKYIDKRNWKKTNEKYVMRGYFYFNPEFLLQ